MNILQSAATAVFTFGALIQNLITPVPPSDMSTITTVSTDQAPTIVETLVKQDDYLLPDMHVFPPAELYIQVTNGIKTMRFDTTFVNVGKGPLELVGKGDSARNVTVASQKIKKTDGTVEEKEIGEFVFHPTHRHWHVDRYGLFQLYTNEPDQDTPKLVAGTDKFSFCIWDEHTYDLKLPNAPSTRQYPRCPNNIQGNSVGWGDTYTANTDGQEIDITGVPDGNYTVRSVVNADNTILESSYTNNEALLNIVISGNKVKVIED